MKTVEVSKVELVKKLQANLQTHKADFDIAWDKFREQAAHNFEQRLHQIKEAPKGAQLDLWVNLVVPEDHSDDYVRALEMLEWEVNDTVELQEHEFKQYVQDDWGWKNAFLSTNQLYTGSASPSSIGV